MHLAVAANPRVNVSNSKGPSELCSCRRNVDGFAPFTVAARFDGLVTASNCLRKYHYASNVLIIRKLVTWS